jgi:hypothetical protein
MDIDLGPNPGLRGVETYRKGHINKRRKKKRKGRGKFVPVHTMKAYRESKGITPIILNLGVRWR